MVKKGALVFALIMIIGFGLVIFIQALNLNVEVGNIEVKYIAPLLIIL
jgi:hypothetical protein